MDDLLAGVHVMSEWREDMGREQPMIGCGCRAQ
jgi:hypothetical protein